jgi:hypothetical protein
MGDFSIPRIKIDGCELINSQVINVFNNEFMVYFDNIGFNFLFIDDPNESAYSIIDKVLENDLCLYKIKIFNLNTGGVQGRFRPLEFGVDDNFTYHYSLTGIAKKGGGDKIVVFNLFRETIK